MVMFRKVCELRELNKLTNISLESLETFQQKKMEKKMLDVFWGTCWKWIGNGLEMMDFFSGDTKNPGPGGVKGQ